MESVDTKNLQEKQLEILIEFDRVCKINNLQYCLAYGTCLGAIRHHGFIPWDDDIDIFMPIEDFVKLNRLYHSFNNPFFLQNHTTDPEYGLLITRIRNSETTLIESSEIMRDINHGIFIDIYPLFNCSTFRIIYIYQLVISMLCRLLLYRDIPRKRGLLLKYGSQILIKLVHKKYTHTIADYLLKIMIKWKKTGYVSSFYGDDSKVKYRYDWFWPPVFTTFEKISVKVPNNSDKFLTFRYGNYMKIPTIENQRNDHHNFLYIDIDTSYTKFKGKLYCYNLS